MAESAAVPILEIKEEFTSCEICTDYYNDSDKCPRILPCYHSFCSQCLESIWENDPAGVKCPNCRQVWPVTTTITESFPSNKIIQNLIDYIKVKTKREHMCFQCPNGSCATVRCIECELWMCGACASDHTKYPPCTEHQTILIEEFLKMPQEKFFQREQMCKQHKSMNLELFCMSCSAAICSSCAHVSHRDHDIQNLTDVYNEKKLLITTALNRLQETSDVCKSHSDKLLTENRILDEMKRSHLQDIDDISNTIIQKVKDKARQLKEKVIASVASQQADISEQVQIIAQSESIKQQHVLYCKQALSYARVLDFIEMSQDLDDKNTTLKKGPKLLDVPIKKDKPSLKTFEDIERILENTALVFDTIGMRTCIDVADPKTGLKTEVIKVNLLPRLDQLIKMKTTIEEPSEDGVKTTLIKLSAHIPGKVLYKAGRTGPHNAVISVQGCNLADHPIVFHSKDRYANLTRTHFFGVLGQPGSNREILYADLTRKLFFGVVGQPGSNREILLPSVQFNEDSVKREECSIIGHNSLVNKPSPAPGVWGRLFNAPDYPEKLKRLPGVRSRSSITSVGASYWETKVECERLESVARNRTAAQSGLCCKNHCDDEIQIADNKHAWGYSVRCTQHDSMCVCVYSRGRCVSDIPIIPFKPRTQLNLTIGFLLDSHTRRLHVIHVNDNKLLYSISDVDVSQSLMPVFGAYSSKYFNVKLRVVSSRDLTLNHELQTLLSSLIHP